MRHRGIDQVGDMELLVRGNRIYFRGFLGNYENGRINWVGVKEMGIDGGYLFVSRPPRPKIVTLKLY